MGKGNGFDYSQVSNYGFDHRRSPIAQLQDLLNISNAQFIKITGAIKDLISTKLNLDRTAQSQTNELSEIVDTLKTLFPAVLDSNKKLVVTRQVAMHYHRKKRSANTRRATRSRLRDRASDRKPSSMQMSQPSQLVLIPYFGKGTNSSQKRPSPPQEPIGRDIRINKPSCLGDGQSTQVPVAVSTNPEPTTTPGHSVSHMHRFLQTCSPSQGHLLSRFVDIGFQDPAMLREVAEKWTSEERRELMKRIAPGLNGKNITELELAALERGFQAIH